MEFMHFKQAVAKQFELMQKHPLFRVDNAPGGSVDQASLKDQLWATYLASFPEGTNPMFRERTEHDCSCCRQFIRAIGDVVAIIDGKIVSLWDVKVPQEPGYEVVANALSALVKSKPVSDVFFHYEGHAGTDKNFEQMVTGVKTWNHFHVNIKRDFVRSGKDIPSLLNGPRTSKQTFLRALKEIDLDSIQTVSDLIATNSIYRGGDYKFQVTEFLKEKKKYDKLTNDADREIFAWLGAKNLHGAVCGIGNAGIGVLLYDLAEGMDLEDAVKKFERSIACPTNYKRPTALVSKQMLEKAKKTIEELGLMSALQRRYATLNDITINNVLFASNDTKQVLSGNVFDELAAQAPKVTKSLDKIEEISIDKFLSDVLPRAEGLELLVENRHTPNFMSLITAVDPTANQLFQWPNAFSWSYSGEFADAIKERVKAAGGNVTGDVCCRLAWEYTDDLDFHMQEPKGGEHIYFGHRRSAMGGQLDVDANGGNGMMEHPVENIFYESKRRMKHGVYTLSVNNWSRRSSGVGFEVEIEIEGTKHHFVYEKVIGSGSTVEVAKIEYKADSTFEVKGAMPSTQSSKQVWGVTTQTFVPVKAVMLSPNFWDGLELGNKQFFFMLDQCVNEGTARGFYNEFLKSELSTHRKALEMVGGKMKVADSQDQLSGLGFSTTARNSVVVRVKGSFTRQLKIVF